MKYEYILAVVLLILISTFLFFDDLEFILSFHFGLVEYFIVLMFYFVNKIIWKMMEKSRWWLRYCVSVFFSFLAKKETLSSFLFLLFVRLQITWLSFLLNILAVNNVWNLWDDERASYLRSLSLSLIYCVTLPFSVVTNVSKLLSSAIQWTKSEKRYYSPSSEIITNTITNFGKTVSRCTPFDVRM